MTAPFAATHDRATLTLASDLLGSLTVKTHDLVRFPDGLYGFPQCRDFALLPAPRTGLYWMQSVEHSALAFVLVDPFEFFPGFRIELSNADLTRLGTSDARDILALAIVTLPSEAVQACTANLQAPVLFNLHTRQAFQSIRSDEGFGIREEFAIDFATTDAPSA
jgi:flagellar assembly factor FliW